MIKEITNSAIWKDEVVPLIQEKMEQLALDFPLSAIWQDVAVNALANKKAYKLLDEWFKEMSFYGGEEKVKVKRDFK